MCFCFFIQYSCHFSTTPRPAVPYRAAARVPQVFGFEVPADLPGVPSKVLNPRDAWSDKESYDSTRTKLAGMFKDNFTKFVKVR